MNLNALPVIGWIMSAFFNIAMAIPFWFTWTWFEVGKVYGYFLPEVYQSPSFWDCVFVFIAVGIIKTVFTPQFVTVTQTNTGSK